MSWWWPVWWTKWEIGDAVSAVDICPRSYDETEMLGKKNINGLYCGSSLTTKVNVLHKNAISKAAIDESRVIT